MTSRMLRRFPVALVLLVLLGAMPVLTAAQNAPLEVYRSPEFGYLFWWDANEWTVQEQATEPGSDWIQLANDDTVFDIGAYAVPGVSAQTCLNERVGQIESRTDLVRFEALDNLGFPPEVNAWNDGQNASTEMVLSFDSPDGRVTFAAREACAAIVPGELLLFTSVWRLAEAFNVSNFLGAAPLDTMTMPRGFLTFAPGAPPPDGPGFLPPVLVFAFDGEELGMLTTHTFYDCTTGESTVVVVAESISFANFVVSPEAIVLENAGEVFAPESIRWIEPALGRGNSAALENGEVALLELAFSDPGLLYYLDTEGDPLVIGELGGCGAGAAAPELIDIDE